MPRLPPNNHFTISPMSWIKENPFVVTLGGVTLVGAGALIFAGSLFKGKYDAALETFTQDAAVVTAAEKLKPYPNPANRDGKAKALEDYKAEIAKLQEAFAKFGPAELAAISPQDLTGNIKAASDKIREAFTAARTEVPSNFFVGFENYTASLAPGPATPVLNDQLGALNEMFLALAKAGPKRLINVHRPLLEEETGKTFDPKDGSYRALPVEVTFSGSEKSLREFVSALAASQNYYYVIRTIRIANEKQTGPVPADGKFDNEGAAGSASGAVSGNPFAGFSEAGTDAAAGAGEAAPAVTPAPAVADTSKILQQVLGTEDITVFIRLDVLRFLPAKDLPKL
jgi:hypothetical protein